MFRRIPSDKLAKKIKLLLPQKSMDQKDPVKSIGLAPTETVGDTFVKSVIDPRLTVEENAILVQKLLEIREALILMLLSKRETSHSKDFVAG